MTIKLKNFIKKIFLISGLFVCLLGFNSYADGGYFCNNCGAKITHYTSASGNVGGSINNRDGAWTTHKNSSNCMNNVTGQKCKKDNIVPYTSQAYSAWETKQNKYESLDEEGRQKLQLINNHQTLINYITEIFSVTDDTGDTADNANNVFSTYNLMKNITLVCINALQKYNQSSLYFLFSFVGILFVFVNYAINFFQNSYNSEGKTMEQYIRMAFQVIFSMFLVCSVSKIAEFFLIFFRYILDFVWNFARSGTLVIDQPEELGLTAAQDIAYNILVGEGITAVGGGMDVLANIMQMLPYALLCIKFFIPYLICVVGKFGILFAIMKNCVEVLTHCFLFPIAAGDVNENLRQSKLVKYSKHILAGSLNLSVIVLILLVCQVITNGFIKTLIDQATAAGNSANVNYFEVSFIMAVLQVVKVVACNGTAKQISGHVAGE